MEENKNREGNIDQLEKEGRKLQKRIIKTYKVDMDPLFAVGDAKDVGKWLLNRYRHSVETIDPDDKGAQKAENKVTTYYEALKEIQQAEKRHNTKEIPPHTYSYLKDALLEEGVEYVKRQTIADGTDSVLITFQREGELKDLGFERGFGQAIIKLAASLPTVENDFSTD